MNVVIVESPAKAKTINKYLGNNYKVFASFGHVRDLSPKDGSVLPEDNFSMKWEVSSDSLKRINEIAKSVKECDKLILATDPDREGEAISWHVLEILKQKKALKDKKIQRVVFNAITKNAVLEAMANPRDVDCDLVDAYLARRAIDYLFGFTLSPILWRKLPGARSAGRVQSVALRLLCERENEIERFISKDYWTICADFLTKKEEKFRARLIEYKETKLGRTDISSQEQANEIESMLKSASFITQSVTAKPVKRHPSPPFTTSTLQQAASAKLGFSPAYTMQISQKLYEGIDFGGETTGLITYMRTDGVQIAPEAITEARETISKDFGSNYVPEKLRFYSTKAKNAQEAHEAIRPTSFLRSPEKMKPYLNRDQLRLYDLIWKRAIASQMASADLERTTIDVEAKNGQDKALLRATGSVIRFDGFLKAYTDYKEDNTASEESVELPLLTEQEHLKTEHIDVSQHATEPSPRFSEASLIKRLEELGIGRPSTYASTMATLRDRGYMEIERKKLIPASKGRIVVSFLENFFDRYIEYNFTASLEEELDLISDGKLDWKKVLQNFWDGFNANIEKIKDLKVSNVLDVLNDALGPFLFPIREDGSNPRQCPSCENGELSLKLGRFGAFVGCSQYPECSYTKQLGTAGQKEDAQKLNEPEILGQDEETGQNITLRTGRFGSYVQCGEGKESKRVGLPKGWQIEDIDLKKARDLLSLPRKIGIHPETQEEITASIGRYGPYLSHNGSSASLETPEDVFTIGINHAVVLLEQSKTQGRKGQIRASTSSLREIGEHPDGGKITVKTGRFGPYINWQKVNVPFPSSKEIESLSLEEAIELIEKKQEKMKLKKPTAKTTAKTTLKKKNKKTQASKE